MVSSAWIRPRASWWPTPSSAAKVADGWCAWDVNQDTLDGIKAGNIDATVAQKPFTMGYVGLKALDEVFHYPPKQLNKDYAVDSFSPYPVFVDTGTSLVDQGNVDLYIASAAAGTR